MDAINSSISLLIYFLLLIILFFFIYKKKWYLLTHENLFKQKMFLLSILVPFSTFIYFGIFAWWGHRLQIDAVGYENFYNISKFPLLLLAMSVPMAAIVNNIHRTIQTEKQIIETQKKNLTDSYYVHLKNTTDYFKDLPEHNIKISHKNEKINKTLRISYTTKLYSCLYPKSNPYDGVSYEVNKLFLYKMIACNNVINKQILSFVIAFDARKKTPLIDLEKTFIKNWNNIEKSINKLLLLIGVPNNNYGISVELSAGQNFTRTNIINFDDLYKTVSAIYNINISILDRVNDIIPFENIGLKNNSEYLELLSRNTNLRDFIDQRVTTHDIDFTNNHIVKLAE